MNIKENVAKNLKHYRELKKLTQRELAEKIGVKHNTISSWENGTNSIDVSVLMQICDLLGVTLDEIYRGKKYEEAITKLSEKEQHVLYLLNKLPIEEQLKFIGRLEAISELYVVKD